MECQCLLGMSTLKTLLFCLIVLFGALEGFAHKSNATHGVAAARSSRDHSVSVREQLQIHSSSHQVYPIDTDVARTKAKFALETEPANFRQAAASQTTSNENKNDGGTVSSANSNRTPDYTFQVNTHVRVDLFCTIDRAFCNKVAGALVDAANDFTQVVNIKNDLVIQASYYSFCDDKCANDTFGWGAPSSQFTLPFEDGADLNYIYPQALAKQLAPYNNTSAWASHDIAIELNHDAYMNAVDFEQAYNNGWNNTGVPPGGKYYFKNDTSIGADQIDLEYIILHEILHGLGFISSWSAYFANGASPFRNLIDGIIDPDELRLVTPSPYWYIKQQTGPVFVTGFQPTMIFDKFLWTTDTTYNSSSLVSLASVGFDMQNFCVQDAQAFIMNFIEEFNASNQSRIANKLWTAMSQNGTLSFHFPAPAINNSTYNYNTYLNETYTSMQLLTGSKVLTKETELSDRNFRLGISISHLDNSYVSTPDFIMTETFITGKKLSDIVQEMYSNIPTIFYNVSVNNTLEQHVYKSPIGPGVLRILDSMGYSTILSNTNYTTTGNVKTGKVSSVCDSRNNNHGMTISSSDESSSSLAVPHLTEPSHLSLSFIFATLAVLFDLFLHL